jgi:hypothetical protein
MGVSLRKSPEDTWVAVGEWFELLVKLPEALIQYESDHNQELKRIFLAVPNRSLVANAISWGLSAHAFKNPKAPTPYFDIQDILNIEAGTRVRLIFPVFQGESRRQIRVGTLMSSHQSGNLMKITLQTNSSPRQLNLVPGVRFSIADKDVPDGDYWERFHSGSDDKSARLNFFNQQQNPQAFIFTEQGLYEEELTYSFMEPSLFDALGVSKLRLGEAVRADQFSDDRHSHFVNTWENFKHFDAVVENLAKVLESYKFIILDGNMAVETLSQKAVLRSSKVIGIFETGRNLLQERGASTFLGEAMYSQPIENFEHSLGWKAPDGIRIWGWV